MTKSKQPILDQVRALPLAVQTPVEWGREALADPIALLIDHAFLEKKAALNAMEMLTRWPGEWVPGWVETMTTVARDEAAHLRQATQILVKRGGRLGRHHSCPYAKGLRYLVRNGDGNEVIDRLFVSALIECRSCERFAILAETAAEVVKDKELASFYKSLFTSELGHYSVFVNLARLIGKDEPEAVESRWQEMLASEARILKSQLPGSRIHSWL